MALTATFAADLQRFDEPIKRSAALTSSFDKTVQDAFQRNKREISSFSGDKVVSETSRMSAASLGFSSVLKTIGPAIAGAFTVGAVVNAVSAFTDFTSKLTDMSQKTGISTTGLQKLQQAFAQSGVSIDAVTGAVTMLGQNLVGGGKGAVNAMAQLGLSIGEVTRLQPDQAFIKVADAVAKVENPMERARLAMDLFGRGGVEVLAGLDGHLAETTESFARMGMILSEDVVKAGDQFGDTLTVLKTQGMAMLGQMIAPMLPALTQLARGLGDMAATVVPALGAAFKALTVTGLNLQVWFFDFMASLAEAGSKVPFLGKALGATTDAAAMFTNKALAARVEIESWNREMPKTEAAARRIVPVMGDYGAATERAGKAAAEAKKTFESMFGHDLIAKATGYVKTLGGVENITKLTTAKKKELHAAVEAALDVYQRLGREAPQILRDILRLTTDLVTTTKSFSGTGSGLWVPFVKGATDAGQSLQNIASGLNASGDLMSRTLNEAAQRTQAADEAFKEWSATHGVLLSNIEDTREGIAASNRATQTFTSTLADMFVRLGQVSGSDGLGRLLGSVGQLLVLLDAAQKHAKETGDRFGPLSVAFDTAATKSDRLAAGIASAAGIAQGAMNVWRATSEAVSTAGKAFAGMMAGAQAGAMFGPWGAAIGAAAGGVTGLVKGWFGVSEEIKKARTEIDAFQKKLADTLSVTQRNEAGNERWKMTVIAVRDAFLKVGRTAADAERIVQQLWNTDRPDKARAAMEEINKVLGLVGDEQEALNDAISRYGFTIEELGPTMQAQKLSEMAQQLVQDYDLLTKSGIAVGTVTERMAEEINDYLRIALKTGQEVPASMRPMLEQMVDMGLLTDEAGNKLTDLKGIKFAETLTQGFDRVANAIGKLPGEIARALGIAASQSDTFIDKIRKGIDSLPDEIHIRVIGDYVEPDVNTTFGAGGGGAAANLKVGSGLGTALASISRGSSVTATVAPPSVTAAPAGVGESPAELAALIRLLPRQIKLGIKEAMEMSR